MYPRLKPLAVLLPLAFAAPSTQAADSTALAPVIISAARVATPDVDATYASEIHSRQSIEASGAVSLYDYLANHTSLQVMPSYGNRFSPKQDMRGFGIGDGHQNIVITVDGQRLNNIDMSPQLIGAISLADIERIEITKGSGAVIHGDGAMAGTVQIHTRRHQGVGVRAYTGSHASQGGSITAGAGNEQFSVHASYDHNATDGQSEADTTGHKAGADSRVVRMGASARLGDAVRVNLAGSSSRLETRYAGSLSKAQFDADPGQNGGGVYTLQEIESDYLRAGIDVQLSEQWTLHVSRGHEDKFSRYVLSNWASDYDHTADEISLQYRGQQVALVAGYQQFDGVRTGAFDETGKDNRATFASGQLFLGDWTLSAGLRQETVRYRHAPIGGATLSQDEQLHGWDLGANYRLDESTTLFANLNRAYQAPDIDRFFSGGTFNQFIAPARAHTLNVGLHHLTARNRFQATLFGSRLKNEIYYYSTGNWLTSYNTNLDKSHKYGLELQDTLKVTDRLTLSGKYAYTRAIIDEEADGGGAYNGKDLPGVSRHAVNLGASYRLGERSLLNLNQVWRSATWAASDFDNNNAQKQRAYQSTDLAYRYQFDPQVTLFAAVENLFDRKNGIWINDDQIYAVNFSRAWRLGLQAAF